MNELTLEKPFCINKLMQGLVGSHTVQLLIFCVVNEGQFQRMASGAFWILPEGLTSWEIGRL